MRDARTLFFPNTLNLRPMEELIEAIDEATAEGVVESATFHPDGLKVVFTQAQFEAEQAYEDYKASLRERILSGMSLTAEEQDSWMTNDPRMRRPVLVEAPLV